MSEADLDGDGNINYEEFVTMLFKVKYEQCQANNVYSVFRNLMGRHCRIRRTFVWVQWMCDLSCDYDNATFHFCTFSLKYVFRIFWHVKEEYISEQYFVKASQNVCIFASCFGLRS